MPADRKRSPGYERQEQTPAMTFFWFGLPGLLNKKKHLCLGTRGYVRKREKPEEKGAMRVIKTRNKNRFYSLLRILWSSSESG